MYTVIASDGKEYGPVADKQIREWIKEKRLTLNNLAKLGRDGVWKRLREIPEFSNVGTEPPTLDPEPQIIVGGLLVETSMPEEADVPMPPVLASPSTIPSPHRASLPAHEGSPQITAGAVPPIAATTPPSSRPPVKCKKCGKEIVADAFECPHCGAVTEGWKSGCLGLIVLAVLVLLIGGCIRACFSDTKKSEPATASAPSPGGIANEQAAPAASAAYQAGYNSVTMSYHSLIGDRQDSLIEIAKDLGKDPNGRYGYSGQQLLEFTQGYCDAYVDHGFISGGRFTVVYHAR